MTDHGMSCSSESVRQLRRGHHDRADGGLFSGGRASHA
eukprot:CAMPEP_0119416654 /NCGR_PEP_ID=MMETSP1335-20130426/13636_1 /TAXON_ID=259385 /ORGANISM="Chrysoculter rhomboideus, Strain RCC1486" /LENGTH=37 /DNA_ID= /DNA_START= /DNA_END= /DNA_ORIENTATION=